MMRSFLIFKLKGPMQAWGLHTFEGVRPSGSIPTKSGIIGLLGACLGIRRNDYDHLKILIEGIRLAVRADQRQFNAEKITDYHTVLDARKDYGGLKSHANSIQTWREYLCDVEYTAAIWQSDTTGISLNRIEAALKKPHFTPYLGRRSCPLARPLFEDIVEAENFRDALLLIEPAAGIIYSDEDIGDGRADEFRDLPFHDRPRQFGNRNVYVYGDKNVPQQN